MLRTTLLHPIILRALASAGHGSRVLIADGNYPFATHASAAAERVYLNLMPGVVTVTTVLSALLTAIPVEAAHVMQPGDQAVAPIFEEFEALLSAVPLQRLERFAFYEQARQPDVALLIATADQRLYANILLTIGLVQATPSNDAESMLA